MALLTSEFKLYPASQIDDTANNGGVFNDAAAIPDNVQANVWPILSGSEIAAGLTRYRKVAMRIENPGNETAQNAGMYIRSPVGNIYEGYIIVATSTNRQSAITGGSRRYGSAVLDTARSAGETTVTATGDNGAVAAFQAGDEIVIQEGANIQFVTINSATPAGDVWTLLLDDPLGASYTTAATVSSVAPFGNVAATVAGAVVTSASGTFNIANVAPQWIGAIRQVWTFRFTSATAYDLDGDLLGASVASGVVGSTFLPINPNTGTAYMSVPSTVWGGTFQSGDTVQITAEPAAMHVFEELVVPAGSPAVSLLTFDLEAKAFGTP